MTDEIYGSERLAELYDLVWGDYADDLEMYEQFARRGERPSLELGAGTGRVALHLGGNGHDVVALDASPAMLARLASKLDPTIAKHVTLFEGDMRAFDLTPQTFDLVFCATNTFQHLLTHEDQIATLEGAARHLASGGVFVLEVRTPRAVDWGVERQPLTLSGTFALPESDDRLMRFQTLAVAANAQTTTATCFFDRVSRDGAVHRTLFDVTLRYTGLPELQLLCERAGLRIANVYGDHDLSPYDDDSDTMIVVAETAR